jgi:hypothetical protein
MFSVRLQAGAETDGAGESDDELVFATKATQAKSRIIPICS